MSGLAVETAIAVTVSSCRPDSPFLNCKSKNLHTVFRAHIAYDTLPSVVDVCACVSVCVVLEILLQSFCSLSLVCFRSCCCSILFVVYTLLATCFYSCWSLSPILSLLLFSTLFFLMFLVASCCLVQYFCRRRVV